MATPLTDGINALTAYANEVTGESDTTLSDAIESLVAGYGGGSAITSGTYTPTEDVVNTVIDVGVTGWTHFLMVAHVLPLETAQNKFFALEYVDFSSGILLNAHSSNANTAPNQVGLLQSGHAYFPTVSGSVITRNSSSGYTGFLYAGLQYDWYVW